MGLVPEGIPQSGSWCEINAGAIRTNVNTLRQRLRPGALLGVVVKGDAYGHGLVPCARAFVEAGADWLVVNALYEAVALRAAGVDAPVYVCGYVPPEQANLVAETGVRVVLFSQVCAEAFAAAGQKAGRPVCVHIKLETGMNRQGLIAEDALALARFVQGLEGIRLEGLTTHFADSDNTTDHRFAREQLDALERVRRLLEEDGIAVPMVHSANSAATLLWPETHGSLVRVGIAAYGLWPTLETYATACNRQAAGIDHWVPNLEPVLSWRTRVVQVKEVSAGEDIGYGRTFRATGSMRIAILPLGYYEGYDRGLSNVAHVLVRGVCAPVRGRVCMNMTMVDVSTISDVDVGTEVTLLGREAGEVLSAEMLAEWMGSIHYEVVSRIHSCLPRLMVEERP
ncbi:MAG: alanine racemase [bacterium]|nr:alanine racemase [bacterium]